MEVWPNCKCRVAGKEGIYQLSNWAKDHIDGYGQQATIYSIFASAPSANLSNHVLDPSAGITTGPPVPVTEAFAQLVMGPDEFSFLGCGVHQLSNQPVLLLLSSISLREKSKK